MASLNDVKKLTRNGQRKEAAQMLQQVLRESPSADAWYYAATLAKGADAKKKYLEKALELNPRHGPSNKLMKQLGGGGSKAKNSSKAKRSAGGGASPVLVVVIVVLVLAVAGIGGFFLLQGGNDTPATTTDADPQATGNPFAADNTVGDTTVADNSAPAADDVDANAAAAATGPLANHFQASGVVAGSLDTSEGSTAAQQIEITLNGQAEPAILNVYASPADLAADRETLFEQTRGNRLMIVQDAAVLFYPNTVDSVTAQTLRDTMRTLPTG
ncbi:MAG: hypothetical protein AAFV33_06980 [Chloroflexota bacterium]